MTNVVKKVSINGQVVPFGGGSTEGAEVVYLTQAEYDALPASKLTDGKIYKIKTSGVVPTPGGGTAIERGDMVMTNVNKFSDTKGYILSSNGVNTPEGVAVLSNSTTNYIAFIANGYGYKGNSGWADKGTTNSKYYNISNGTWESLFDFALNQNVNSVNPKYTANGMYLDFIHNGGSSSDGHILFVDYNHNVSEITQEDWNSQTNHINIYKGLYYSQDNNDYVAVDSTGTEVKRYSNVGTINGIYDDKLYRNVGDVAYAIATI